jgi:hypothetical protein
MAFVRQCGGGGVAEEDGDNDKVYVKAFIAVKLCI